MKTNDPVQLIQDKLDETWALNERDGFGQPDALIAIKNLLKLVRAYEEIVLKFPRSMAYDITINGIKNEIFNNKGESDV